MPIGVMLHVLALVMLPFSSLEPLLKRLGLRRPFAALILAAGLASALLPPIALSGDLSVSMSLPYCIALAASLLLAESRYKVFALFSAVLGGVLALGAKAFFPRPSLEPGFFVGLLAAAGAFIAGRHLKPRLSGALLGPVLAHLIFSAVEYAGFGYVSPVLGGSLFFDESSISLFLACFAAVIFEPRRQEIQGDDAASKLSPTS